MKKIMVLFLTLSMILSCSMIVNAESTTTLTTTVEPAEFTLNIPENQVIAYGEEETDIGSITVTNSKRFAVGKNLYVTATYEPFKCDGVTTTIPYELVLRSNNEGLYDEKWASETAVKFAGSANGFCDMYYQGKDRSANYKYTVVRIKSTDWGKALAGEYSSVITFTTEIKAE